MIRFNVATAYATFFLFVMSIITILIAGGMASYEWDIKKLIAFSTLSQLGFIVLSVCLGLFYFCFFHLLCHALFKASIFISSGVMIHTSDRRQDFRNSIKFIKNTPIIISRILVRVLCLCGFPFLRGFLSKDYILDSSLFSLFYFVLFVFAVFLTSSYSLRFCFYVFISVITFKNKITKFYEAVLYIGLSSWVFSFCGVFLGLV